MLYIEDFICKLRFWDETSEQNSVLSVNKYLIITINWWVFIKIKVETFHIYQKKYGNKILISTLILHIPTEEFALKCHFN